MLTDELKKCLVAWRCVSCSHELLTMPDDTKTCPSCGVVSHMHGLFSDDREGLIALIEAEVPQAQEPVAVYKGLVSRGHFGGVHPVLELLKAIPIGSSLFLSPTILEAQPVARVREHDDYQATVDWLLNPLPDCTVLFEGPQPPAPCPKCAQHEIDFALEHDDKIALQAKVAEQSALIEKYRLALDLVRARLMKF